MKKLITGVLIFLTAATIFAQSANYTAYLSKAKEYASQKKWCHALECYYDAMGCDDEASVKEEAYKSFTELKKAILSGNPGLGKFNAFTLHDEWKNLLIDAEQVGSSFSKWQLTLGDLVQGDLDYTTRTAIYYSKISVAESDRYMNTVDIVDRGYQMAYRDDWSGDFPKYWPKYSVSSRKDDTYDVDGALVFHSDGYYNAFEYESDYSSPKNCFRYEFNIVDENGKELVKGVSWFLDKYGTVYFTDIGLDVMDLIDNGKAFINPVSAYLKYGENDVEVQLPMEKNVFICWNNKSNKIADKVDNLSIHFLNMDCVKIPGKNFKMMNTEVTQAQYKAVMGENPSKFKGDDNPVEKVNWYDAIYFCNKLSLLKGFEAVYSVNGSTDVSTWGYTPHQGDFISGTITQNTGASGYRLPTEEEWLYAAKGGQNFTYAGSDNLDQVGWYSNNSGYKTHPVAEKAANAYGLYDMSGNVSEWVWDSYGSVNNRLICGGSYDRYDSNCEVDGCSGFNYAGNRGDNRGFRIVCSLNTLE